MAARRPARCPSSTESLGLQCASRVAQRLPRPLGQTLVDEADAYATPEERTAAMTLLANGGLGAL